MTIKLKTKTIERKIMKSVSQAIKSSHQHSIIKSNHGASKSFGSIKSLHNDGHNVYWLVRENADVEVRVQQLKDRLGIDALGITSLDHQLQKRNLHGKKYKQYHLYDYAKLADVNNIIGWYAEEQNISVEDAELFINDLVPPKPSFENHQIIVMTAARMLALKFERTRRINAGFLMEQIEHNKAIFVVDDVSEDLVKKYTKVTVENMRFSNSKVLGETLEIITHKKAKLFVKPEGLSLSHGLPNKFIWLTADTGKAALIQSMYGDNCQLIDQTHDIGDAGGVVDVIGHKIATKKYNIALKPIVARVDKLMRDKKQSVLIGDGLCNEINCFNVEGSNDYMRTNNIIKISQPHLNRLFEYSAQLPDMGMYEIKQMLVLDQFEQMVGRNRGIRYINNESLKVVRNSECIVIIDPSMLNFVKDNTYFNIRTAVNLDKNPASIKKPTVVNRLNLLMWLISHAEAYMLNELDDLGSRADRLLEDIITSMSDTRDSKVGEVCQRFVDILKPAMDRAQKLAINNDSKIMSARDAYTTALTMKLLSKPADVKSGAVL